MKNLKKWLVAGLFCSIVYHKTGAQVYGAFNDGIREINLCNCTLSAPVSPVVAEALAAGNNEDLYYLLNGELILLDVPSGNTSVVASLPAGLFSVSMVYGPDGLIYLTGTGISTPLTETLITIDPTDGTLTIVGDLPTGFVLEGDLFFNNGSLYGFADQFNTSVLLEIPVANPGGATVVQTLSPETEDQVGGISVFVNGVETVFALTQSGTVGAGLVEMDINSGDASLVCSGPISGAGDLGAPPNYELPACCENDAGSFESLGLFIACANESISLPHLGDEILNPDAALSFILFDPDGLDFPDDVIQISDSPTFNFDPATMIPSQIYYVAAVAAPGAAGAPDWTSDCIDFSLYAEVAWLPVPSVTFSAANPDVCAGACTTVTANFTGTAPFTLTYTSPVSGSVTQTFSGNTGTFQVCTAAGAPQGSFSVQATALTDAFCTCQ